jgi:cytochrome oxidase Cu insertion factor (SCO1/SenC/PrrC family)
MRHDQPTDISLKALLIAGSLSILALWWAWPRMQLRQQLHAELSQLTRFEARTLPDFRLDGIKHVLTPAALKGQWTIIYFAHSRCADDCPTALGVLASLYRRMTVAEHARSLRIIVLSIEQEDDPRRFQEFASSFHSNFEGYTGTWEEREKLFLFFEAAVDRSLEQRPDQYYHPPNLFLLDPEAHYVATWNRIPERNVLHQELCTFINCPP